MQVRRLSDASEFLAAASPLLLEDEARHNLLLGLAGTLRDRPGYYREFRLWLVEGGGGGIVGAALQTPPFSLVLARPTEVGATSALAEAIATDDLELPGVGAATPEVDDFADAWERWRPVRRTLRRAQRIYRLTEIRPPASPTGRPREATAEDTQLLIAWLEAFAEETLTDVASPAQDAERVVAGRLQDDNSGFLLWEDGRPVSLAGWSGPTPNGIRIGPVYTPPEWRSRGYGSAVTAAASAEQLAAGRRFCFLYTDLANPTSNRIYMEIGYEPVCDAVDYRFEAASPAP
jgi:predicted GNAT family acetyltransferase